MGEKPILMSGPMVRALLAGTKTQTRRAVKPQPSPEWYPVVQRYHPAIERRGEVVPGPEVFGAADELDGRPCPYGAPGDRLWVKETWSAPPTYDAAKPTDLAEDTPIRYAAEGAVRGVSERFVDADGLIAIGRLRPSIFMRRWMSRITLEITDVRVQRLQEIGEEDARAEGVTAAPFCKAGRPAGMEHAEAFEDLWGSINGEREGCSWAANPWVWVISFRRVEVPRA
jgi:hypothetical protein